MSRSGAPAGRLRSLYVCYFPLSEPLVQTQVLAYLRGLAAAGHEIHLLTWEVERQSRAERAALRATVAGQGVRWHRRRYHKRPSLLATAWDVVAGIATAGWLARRHRIDVLHVRTHVPAAMGLAVRRLLGTGLVFDIRGLMAEEYVDAGTWSRGSLPYRAITWVQGRAIEVADGVIVLTERGRALLFGVERRTPGGAPVAVIPSCVDVEQVVAASDQRGAVRRRLGFDDDDVVLVYVGKFSTWYMAEEMARLAAVAADAEPRLRFLVLTQSPPELIVDELAAAGFPSERSLVTRCRPEEVGAHLAAADLALSFIRSSPSKIASSPTKVGEYLAAGLPVLVSHGVGDVDELLEATGTGVVITAHDREAHLAGFCRLRQLAADEATPGRCRAAAEAHLSLRDVGVPRYEALYEEVAARRASQSEAAERSPRTRRSTSR